MKKFNTENDTHDVKIESQPHDFLLHTAADIIPRKIKWLWPGRFAIGYLSIVAADGGLGKSSLLMNLAAIVTNGSNFPFSEGRAEAGDVVWITGEESLDSQLKPRSMAAGVEQTRIHFTESIMRAELKKDGSSKIIEDTMKMSTDAIQLVGLKEQYPKLKLVIIDPVSSFNDARDTHRESDVRQVMLPWIKAAERADVAVIFIAHFNKGAGGHVRDKLSGSNALRNAVRAVHVLIENPDSKGEVVFLLEKNNLADGSLPGLIFRLVSKKLGEDHSAPIIEWLGVTDQSANDVFNSSTRIKSALDMAKEFLSDELTKGPVSASQIRVATIKGGMSWTTIKTAKKELGIISKKIGFQGKSAWCTEEQLRIAATDKSKKKTKR